MEEPNHAAQLCEDMFDEAFSPDLAFENTFVTSVDSPDHDKGVGWWAHIRDQGTVLKSLLMKGNTFKLQTFYIVSFVKVRMTTNEGTARELNFQFDGPVPSAADFTHLYTPQEYMDGSRSFTSTHVDTFEELKAMNRAVSFSTAVWTFKDDQERNAHLGTQYITGHSGAYVFQAGHSSPAKSVMETGLAEGRAYAFDEQATQITRCGQVLFAAATPHRALGDIVQHLNASGIRRRFNIMFMAKPRGDVPYILHKRMFRIFKGPIPRDRWVRGADGKWTPAADGQPFEGEDEFPVTHLLNTLKF